MKLCEEMGQVMDCSEVLILMDLSKTFDCLSHDLMAVKLIAYEMYHLSVKILISYLRHHKHLVKIGSDSCHWMAILNGIPQGSIVGPSLFQLFFNDFMYILKLTSAVNIAHDKTDLLEGTLSGKHLRMPKPTQNQQSYSITTIKCRQMPPNSILCTLA